MRKAISILMVLLLVGLTCPLSAVTAQEPVQGQTAAVPSLTNKDIVEMNKSGLAQEIIIAKIKNSPSNFDTAPAALQELKSAGIADPIILAMVQTSAPSEVRTTASGDGAEVRIPDGTEIEIQLVNNVSGQEAKIGNIVDFTVLRPVVVNGVTVIEKDASARARITTAKKAGRWGKAGKLEWAMQDVQAVNGERVPARFTQRALGDSKGGTVAVAAVATTVLLGPVGLLWGLKKGKPAIIPAGNRYNVFVQGDTVLKVKPAASTAQATPQPTVP